MIERSLAIAFCLAAVSSCAAVPSAPRPSLLSPESLQTPEIDAWRPPQEPTGWQPGQVAMQGFIGAGVYDSITREGGDTPDIETDNDQFPVIGGGAQWKMAGERIDFGFEGMFAASWRANIAAFVAGGGGAAVAVDVDVLLLEIFAGPYLSAFLGDRWRVYAAAGPQVEWVDYDQNGNSLDDSGSGFGTGVYARGGLEYVVSPGLLVGFGVRWADLSVDLGSNLGDLDMDGIQYVLTVTRGI